MEEIYENNKIVVKLTYNELLRMLRGEFLKGYKIKQIGMVIE